MRDIIDKKKKLCNYSKELRTLKFRDDIIKNGVIVDRMIKEQNEIYKQYEFYKYYIEACNKERRR